MELSLRLRSVAQMVAYRTVADIGTDHGYVPIYMIENQLADYVIACDINEGPLKRAKENIHQHGFNSQIETRLGNGLSPIERGEVETVVIAGMGGMLMIDILRNYQPLTKNLKQLVLSPHLDIYQVRKYLHEIQFKIERERMLKEDGKFYTIISAVPGIETYTQEMDYLFGKYNLDVECLVLKEYLEYSIQKLEVILVALAKGKGNKSQLKEEETKRKFALYKEALKRYEMQ